MTYKAEHSFLSKSGFLLMALCFVFALIPCRASAVDISDQAVLQLTGRQADGRYELNAKDLYLFSLEGVAPGDLWHGSVNVQNTTDADMAVAVHSIVSTLKQDTTLFDALNLIISVEGERCYLGPYAAVSEPVTKYYLIDAGDDLSFDIQVSLPAQAGNACQGKQMDSTWTFDAVYFSPEGSTQMPSGTDPGVSGQDPSSPVKDIIQTGRFMIASNTELITCLLLFLSSGAGLIFMAIRYCKARKRTTAAKQSDAQCNPKPGKEDEV